MMREILLEGPFESNYSLAIVNRRLAKALHALGKRIQLHQRDNTTAYFPSGSFLHENPELAPLFVPRIPEQGIDIHSRYIYPPHTDSYAGRLRAIHCYGWEETSFPAEYVRAFNRDLDLLTVMSAFVRDVLEQNGVRTPIRVVGLGADHILDADPVPIDDFDSSGFLFLHVSSCFPRKGADVLVKAFCQEFTRRDDVRLVIKTFANPHNQLTGIVEEVCSAHASHAPIEIIWKTLRPGEMRWLYSRAGCLVSASRGEGFGLPVAEAMLVGCPVIATIYSGQADICSEANCWPVEFVRAPAHTHLTEGRSWWIEPNVHSLRSQMRALYRASQVTRREVTAEARRSVEDRFTWTRVAQRHWSACCDALGSVSGGAGIQPAVGLPKTTRLGFVTSWNTRCGIAEYSRYLVTNLPAHCDPIVFATTDAPVRPDEAFVIRCWQPDDGADGAGAEPLIQAILESRVDAVSLQFNFGFFSPSRLEQIVDSLQRNGIVTTITLHATKHEHLTRLKAALAKADRCICHRSEDAGRIREGGQASNVALLRHGIQARSTDPSPAGGRRPVGSFVVSCFGFFLPPKGIHQLIQAMALARRVNPLLRLNLLNALYPAPESKDYCGRCLEMIEEKGLAGSVSITTEFLDDEIVLGELSRSDLIVLPYLYSSESSSAAIRPPIASMTPVLCSSLEIFDEFSDCVHRYPAGDVIALANEILRLSSDPGELHKFRDAQAKMVSDLSWPVIAAQFADLCARRSFERTPARSGG